MATHRFRKTDSIRSSTRTRPGSSSLIWADSREPLSLDGHRGNLRFGCAKAGHARCRHFPVGGLIPTPGGFQSAAGMGVRVRQPHGLGERQDRRRPLGPAAARAYVNRQARQVPHTVARKSLVFSYYCSAPRAPPEARWTYDLIEKMYPHLPKIELFARNAREGWACWGNQAPALVADTRRRFCVSLTAESFSGTALLNLVQ